MKKWYVSLADRVPKLIPATYVAVLKGVVSLSQRPAVAPEQVSVRLVVCDDHLAFGEAIATVLIRSGHSVAEVTATPEYALAACRRHRPDMCLMDLRFPDGDGFDGVAAVAHEGVSVVVVTAHADDAVVRNAFGTGASGVVSKASGLESLLNGIAQVANGHRYFDSALPGVAAPRPRRRESAALLAAYLTPREREVLGRMVNGESTATMSASMNVSVTTVRSHVQSVLSKLNVSTRLAAVAYATAHGIVSPPDRYTWGEASA